MKKLLSALILSVAFAAPAHALQFLGTEVGMGDEYRFIVWDSDLSPSPDYVMCMDMIVGNTPVMDFNSDCFRMDGDTLENYIAGLDIGSFSGSYTDLTDKPTIPTLPIAQSDVTGLTSALSAKAAISSLSTVATSGVYSDLTGKPSIPTTFDGLTDGATNKAYTATEKTKLSGIASGSTANDTDANLKNRANHTGTQAISTVTGLQTALDNKPQIYVGGTLKADAKMITKSSTVSSGTAVFYLTDSELVGGTALCPNNVYEQSVNVYVNDATASYQWQQAVTNSNKTLTVTINKLTTANILTGILGQASTPNGTVVRLTVLCD